MFTGYVRRRAGGDVWLNGRGLKLMSVHRYTRAVNRALETDITTDPLPHIRSGQILHDLSISAAGSETSALVRRLQCDVTYSFRVSRQVARDGAWGDWSRPVTGTTSLPHYGNCHWGECKRVRNVALMYNLCKLTGCEFEGE